MKPSRGIGVIAICGLVIVSGFFGAPAVSASPADIRVDTALANPQQMVQRPWRSELAGALRELPQWKQWPAQVP